MSTPETFDDISYFPTDLNNCMAYLLPLRLSGMTFTSIGGDGTVWECGPNQLYAYDGKHLALEAGAKTPAEIRFDAPIVSLSFDYAARLGPLEVEVIGDDHVLTTLFQAENGKSSLWIDFSSPIVSLQIRSKNGTTNQIALDNITYQLAGCTPPSRGST